MSFIHIIKIEGGEKMKVKIIAILIIVLLIISLLPSVTSFNKLSKNNLVSMDDKELEDSNFYAQNEFFVKFKVESNLKISKSRNIMITGIKSIDDLNKEFNIIDIKETFLSRIKKPKNPELFSLRLYKGDCILCYEFFQEFQSILF